jgi:hypothetical protein
MNQWKSGVTHISLPGMEGASKQKNWGGKRNGWIAVHLPIVVLSLIFPYRSYLGTLGKGI